MITEITSQRRGYPVPTLQPRKAALPKGIPKSERWYTLSNAYLCTGNDLCVAQLIDGDNKGKWIVWTGSPGLQTRRIFLVDTDEEATSLIVADILKGE